MNIFKKKKEEEVKVDTIHRDIRELLRENLKTIPVDMFYSDDPLVGLDPESRRVYLKRFHDIARDEQVIARIKWLVNKQARILLYDSKTAAGEGGIVDTRDLDSGAMTINGIALVKDDFERLEKIYIKENAPKPPMTRTEQFQVFES